MLIYPATDSTTVTESRRALAEGYMLTRDLMDWFWQHYVPAGTDQSDLRLSPLLAKDSRDCRRPSCWAATLRTRPAYTDRGRHQDTTAVPGTIRLLFADALPQSGTQGQRRGQPCCFGT
jgi:acetyl esterase/lipase